MCFCYGHAGLLHLPHCRQPLAFAELGGGNITVGGGDDSTVVAHDTAGGGGTGALTKGSGHVRSLDSRVQYGRILL